MPPPLRAPWAPTSTRCFLFGRGMTFLLDETLLPADAEHVTSRGDSGSNRESAKRARLPARGEGRTCLPSAPGTSPASIRGEPSWGGMDLPAAVRAPQGRRVPPAGSPCNAEGDRAGGGVSLHRHFCAGGRWGANALQRRGLLVRNGSGHAGTPRWEPQVGSERGGNFSPPLQRGSHDTEQGVGRAVPRVPRLSQPHHRIWVGLALLLLSALILFSVFWG